MDYDFDKTVTIYLKTGIVIPTCSRLSVEDLAKEMIKTFSIFPLMSIKNSRHVIIEDFMSMLLKLNVEFELGYGSIEIAESISETIKEIMNKLPMVSVKYVTTEIVTK